MKRLRGPRGTKAHLGIMREDIDETIYIDVIRDKIPLNSVDAAFMEAEDLAQNMKDEYGFISLDGTKSIKSIHSTMSKEVQKLLQLPSENGTHTLTIKVYAADGTEFRNAEALETMKGMPKDFKKVVRVMATSNIESLLTAFERNYELFVSKALDFFHRTAIVVLFLYVHSAKQKPVS